MNIPFMRFTHRVTRLFGIVGLITTSGMPLMALAEETNSAPASSAVWQAYDLDFHYFGTTTYYSCSGLENRLKDILRELGANKDVRVGVTGCYGPADIGKMLTGRIKVRMPMISSDASTEAFPVVAKTVSLRSGRDSDSIGGDCELLEQVRDQILPALKLQALKDDLNCIPGGASYASRSLQVAALVPEAKSVPSSH